MLPRQPGKLIVQSYMSARDHIARTLQQGICRDGAVQMLLHAALAASRVVAVKVISFSSVLFCCITHDWYLFQAGFWFICMSRSDAELAAGDSRAKPRPSRRASSSPRVLQKH